MSISLLKSSIALLCFLLFPAMVFAVELHTTYATILYEEDALLRKFNKKLYLPKNLYLLIKNKKNVTIEDEITNKINIIVEKSEVILEMFPKRLQFKIVLLDDKNAVGKAYQQLYGRNIKHLAFYAPTKKTIFFSVKNVELAVVAHEIGHAIIEQYYTVPTPEKIHEVLAQYVVANITN